MLARNEAPVSGGVRWSRCLFGRCRQTYAKLKGQEPAALQMPAGVQVSRAFLPDRDHPPAWPSMHACSKHRALVAIHNGVASRRQQCHQRACIGSERQRLLFSEVE